MQFFESMKQQGVVPNAITHNALISACEKGKDPEGALLVFKAMQQQGLVTVPSPTTP